MSAPLIWMGIPLLVAVVLAVLSTRPTLVLWVSIVSTSLLAFSAKWLPIGTNISIGPWTAEISSDFVFFGRRFIIQDVDRPLLCLLYLLLAFWFMLSRPHPGPIKFYPLGLVSISLVITGYAVEPVFYAALFFGFLAMTSVILLSPAGSFPTAGVLRFLAYQVLGMICILFAAWLLSWVDVDRMGTSLLNRTMVLMGLGFSFFLGIFPFTSWISMISEENHPFLVAFIFTIYLNGVLLFGFKYLTQTSWLLDTVDLLTPIQLVGLLMVAIGGLSAMFSDHLGRMLGAGAVTELGRSLVAFSLLPDGLLMYFSLMIMQGVAFGLWSTALTTFRHHAEDLDYAHGVGLARRFPVYTIGMFSGFFTIAGLPLWGGFPFHWALGTSLMADGSYPLWPFFLGNVGLWVGGLRMLSVLGHVGEETNLGGVDLTMGKVFILLSSTMLLLIGLFPQLLVRWVTPLPIAFQP